MQDFYNQFKLFFDLKLNSFFNFIDNYVDAENYSEKYGSFENISKCLKSKGSKYTNHKNKTKLFEYKVVNKENTNIFEWNNYSIITDLRKVIKDLKKSGIDNIYLTKFVSFMCEDLSNEFKIYNSEGLQFINEYKDYRIENTENIDFLEKSLHSLITQDFYYQFLEIFDLKLNSFFNFIDKYIHAGNYEKKYGSFENVSEYFLRNKKVFTEEELKPNKYTYRGLSTEFVNIFNWNNDTIIVDLRNLTIELQKNKIDSNYLFKFITFMCEDLNNEYQIFNSAEFESIKVKKNYGIENSESVNFRESSLLSLRNKKELLENLQIKISEINKSNFLNFFDTNKNLADSRKEQTNHKNSKLSRIQWNDTEEGLIRLFDCLYNSGLISTESYKNRFSIITKTFLNKDGGEFKNKQLGVKSQRIKSEKIKENSTTHDNFEKLISNLSKFLQTK